MVVKVAIKVEVIRKSLGYTVIYDDFIDDLMAHRFLSFSLSLVAVGLPVEGAGGWSSDEAGPAFSCWSQPAEVVVQQDRSQGQRVAALLRVQPLCSAKMAQPKFARVSFKLLPSPVGAALALESCVVAVGLILLPLYSITVFTE